MILFIMFINKYVIILGEKERVFEKDLEEPIQYVSTLNVEHVYIDNSITQPYIYTLFYTKTPPEEFRETVKYNYEKVAFESISSFGKYEFYLPEINEEEDAAYLVPNNYYKYESDKFEEVLFKRFKVLINKKKINMEE